jgi:prevent-host-death family protein
MFLAMHTRVNVADLKNKLTDYLAMVEKGAQVIVCRRNVPVARLERIQEQGTHVNRSKLGSMKGTVKVLGDLTEPLIPEADWEMLT